MEILAKPNEARTGFQIADRDKALLKELMQTHDGFRIIPVPKRGKRSLKQNGALHLMFEWTAEQINNSGLTLKDLTIDVDLPINAETVKELWRAIQIDQTGKASTTQLDKSEIDQVFTVFARHLADKGIEIMFPSAEKRSEFFAALDMAENLDYPVYEGETAF